VIAQGNTIDGVVSSTSRMKFAGNVQPGLEARLEDIQEMSVQSSQADLNQGMGLAAMQVNFVTRSGSNDYHGRVFEDFRNTALNANSWFNNAVGLPKTPIILNEFGGSAGGHIIKDKLFFFGSFAMAKQPGGYIAGSQVLSSLAQQGILTEANGTQVNLFTQVAQPNGLPNCVTTPSICQAFATQQALINKGVASGGVSLSDSGDSNVQNVSWLVPSPTTIQLSVWTTTLRKRSASTFRSRRPRSISRMHPIPFSQARILQVRRRHSSRTIISPRWG
jgi:hypothetical protein